MSRLLMRAAMRLYESLYWRPVQQHAQRPDAAQQDVFRRLVGANSATRFGVEHGFADIRTVAEFRERVPVQDYEALRPYIDEQRRTGAQALTAESPLFYAQTSGTTGKPKYIPITPTTLKMQREEQALFSYLQFRACPEGFEAKTLAIVAAAVEARLDSGHTVGSMSGYLYQTLPALVRSRFILPPEVATIGDYGLKYLVMLRLALGEPRISYLGAANPSTFLHLLDVLNDKRDVLLDSLQRGRLDGLETAQPAVRDAVASRLRPNPERAARLRALPSLTFASVWPDIRLVTTWTGGSCGIALNKVRQHLPERAKVMELGYQSSEFRGTLAMTTEEAGGLPPLHHHFFEFVDPAAWDSQRPEFLTLDQLEIGRRYYVLVTTAAGLFRYFMNDLVEVTGMFHHTPLLRFVQKGRGVTSMTGEKLYEAQVIEAVQDSARHHGMTPSFFVLVADEATLAYRLFIEPRSDSLPEAASVASAIDRRLGELNIEYQGKRLSGRLAPLTVAWLKTGTDEAYKAACVQAGQREGQFKPAVLQYRKDLIIPIDRYATD